ncbi:MAG: glycosyltransferase N-terminal domain-containing protein [Marinilabiliales bacterium]
MVIIYNIVISLYYSAILISSIFNKKARLWINGRKNFWNNFKNNLPQGDIIWFHSASLGEFEQGRPILEQLKKKYPGYKICLSFFSPSGYNAIIDKTDDFVIYLPIDTKKNAKKFIELLNPKIAIFVRYEFWYHYLKQLYIKNIPSILVSANFRKNQMFFKWYGKWYRNILKFYTLIFVQNNKSAELLNKYNIKTFVSGDSRIDRVYEISQSGKQIDFINEFKNGKKIIIFGSAWNDEIKLLQNFLSFGNKNIKYIIAPHLVHRENIERIIKELPLSHILYSNLNSTSNFENDCLIIDKIGILPFLYQYADIAVVGGGFLDGIHSILEPATFGIPVIFGPKYHKFNEAIDLIEIGASFSVKNQNEFNDIINKLLNNHDFYKNSSLLTKEYIKNNIGATKKTLEIIEQNQLL